MLPQKVLHYREARAKNNFKFESYAIFTKLDGWYVYIDANVETETKGFHSSAGRLIPSLSSYLPDFDQFIANHFPATQARFIFEVTHPNLDFYTLNGVLNRKNETAEGVVFNLHDYVLLNNLAIPFEKRYQKVEYFGELLKSYLNCKVCPIIAAVGSEKLLFNYAEDVINAGEEGIILKALDKPYFPGKRNASMMKIKRDLEIEAKVVRVNSGEGKYINTTGSLSCLLPNGRIQDISGFTDFERDLWWKNKEQILNKTITIKAMLVTPEGLLREPRFKCVRNDLV